MKSLGFTTILLSFVAVLLLMTVIIMGYVIYTMRGTGSLADYWKSKRLFVIAPTVLNVVSMFVLGVVIVMG